MITGVCRQPPIKVQMFAPQISVLSESHVNGFTKEAESRLAESQTVFDATVSELSERLAALENEFAATQANLEEERQARSDLSQQLDASNQSLTEAQQSNAKLVTDNDGLRG